MGIFDWWKKAESGQVVSADEIIFEAGKEEAAGLNFKSAIDAHIRWKLRLAAVIAGTSDEVLDPAVVGRDDQCVLGKWIHGEGGRAFSDSIQFAELREAHADFHQCAARVLIAAQGGDKAGAEQLLNSGDYPRASVNVTSILAKLYARYQAK